MILHFLRARSSESFDNLAIKTELFETIPFKEVQLYCTELIKDSKVLSSKWDGSKIQHQISINDFIEEGGYVYTFFKIQTKSFDSEKFHEAYLKDLLLTLTACNPSAQWSLNVIHDLFPSVDIGDIRQYQAELENKGYIRRQAQFQSYDAKAFLDSGGYIGMLLQHVSEQESLSSKRTKRMNKWKQTVEYRQLGLKYYLPLIIIAALLILFVLVRFNVIHKDQALNFIKWAFGVI